MRSTMNMKRSVAAPLGQRRRAGMVVRARAATETLVAHRPTTAAQPSPASAKVTSSRDEVLAMHARLAAKSKALISLEEMQAANRPTARIILKKKVGLGEVWKLTGSCPELGNMNPQVAPAMQWTAGDVWVLETRIREGSHTFKAVLRRGDGAYIWEAGQDRTLNVSGDLGKDDKITLELDVKMPY